MLGDHSMHKRTSSSRSSLHRRVRESVARRLEAQHHDVARIRLGGPEQGIGAMEAIQDAQDTETVVESN